MKTNEFHQSMLEIEACLNLFAKSLTPNTTEALNLVHDTFGKALAYREHIESNSNLRAWAFTIMRNTFMNNKRELSQARARENSIKQFILANRPQPTSQEPPAPNNELDRMVVALDPEYRIAFQLYAAGYKYKDIAAELGTKVGTVKSRIYFSSKKLMKQLNKYTR